MCEVLSANYEVKVQTSHLELRTKQLLLPAFGEMLELLPKLVALPAGPIEVELGAFGF